MVRLEELEDEHFLEKPAITKDNALLVDDDDDDDYTDTDSEISEASDVGGEPDETLLDRIVALKDMISPKTRAQIASVSNSIYNTTSSGITYSGKGLWVVATSVLLLGLPYALALGDEQQILEEESQRAMLLQEDAQGLMNTGDGQTGSKPAL